MDNFSAAHLHANAPLVTSGGAVVSQHRYASEAGAGILRSGGNAMDAAVATAFMLGVVEPWMSGVGGGGYLMVGGRGRTPRVIDFSLRAPLGVRPGDYPVIGPRSNDLFPWPAVARDSNVRGPLSICAPTMAAGLECGWREFGARPWAALLEPAIARAREGLTVDWYTQLILSSLASALRHDPAARGAYLDEGGASIAAGWATLALPRIDLGALPDTLSRIAAGGSSAITDGEVGRAMIADVQRLGGVLQQADFECARPRLLDAAQVMYRALRVWTTPGFSGGVTLVRILDRLGQTAAPGASSHGFFDAVVRAVLPELRHRLDSVGDCDAAPASPGCTTHFCVADSAGLVVSATITLVSMFGSKVLSPNTGVMLNNAMSWFNPAPGQPNSIEPGKNCLSNMAPAIVDRGDGTVLALGAAGGRKIVPAVAQLIALIGDAGLPLDQACRHPRVDIKADGAIIADPRLGEQVLQRLSHEGPVHPAAASVFPNYFGIISALSSEPGRVTAVADAMIPPAGAAAAQP